MGVQGGFDSYSTAAMFGYASVALWALARYQVRREGKLSFCGCSLLILALIFRETGRFMV